MQYAVFGHEVEIQSFEKAIGSVFEVQASETISEIGLPTKFYFQSPDKFSVEVPESGLLEETQNTDQQQVLAFFLLRSICYGELVHQFSLEGLDKLPPRFFGLS